MKGVETMLPARIGFIGFGEVASILSKAIREHGAEVHATDILLDQEKGDEIIRSRMLAKGIQLGSLPEVIQKSDYVLSTVTTQVAKTVAKEASSLLRARQIYLDLNSTSPASKVDIGQVISSSEAEFVEGAVLGAVGVTGAQTRILVAGASGEQAARNLTKLGLNVSFYSPEIGKASMFKMLRSIFSKGLECLILELLIAGRRAGIEEDLWKDITSFMAKRPFDQIADNWVRTHAIAHERRYHEMHQVVETMLEIGVEPIMSNATRLFFQRSVSLRFDNQFPAQPDSSDEVVNALEVGIRTTLP